MASRKAPAPELSQALQFNPHIIFDPVPWPFILQHLDKSAVQKAAQVQLDLHQSMLEARLDATKRMNSLIKGK